MRPRLPYLLVGLALAQLGAGECGGGITRDPGFDLWCGEELCAWKTVRGEIRRAATWHAKDAGVEFLGEDAAIAQLATTSTPCMRFDLIANVEERAEVMVSIDVFGDGRVERMERIPTTRWEPVSFVLPIETPYRGVRFEIGKRGTGTAVVAQVEVKVADAADCAGLVPSPNQLAPNGSPCGGDAGCQSGRCRPVPGAFTLVCVGCEDGTCGGTDVCGLGEPLSAVQHVPITCVPAGGRELGEDCLVDEECATGICNHAYCSTCDASAPCTGAEQCGTGTSATNAPWVCAPRGHLRTSGQPCTQDADCASSVCNGAVRKECSDHRACGSPMDCPGQGDCNVVGIQGGSCQ